MITLDEYWINMGCNSLVGWKVHKPFESVRSFSHTAVHSSCLLLDPIPFWEIFWVVYASVTMASVNKTKQMKYTNNKKNLINFYTFAEKL